MEKLIDQYKNIIQLWQKKDFQKLESMVVSDELDPLKLFLLKKENEGQKLLESIDIQSIELSNKAFLLEAILFDMPYYPLDENNIKLAREITSIFENAYFGNFTIALDLYEKKDYRQTKELYKKMLQIAPNSEKIVLDLIYLCFLLGDNPEIRTWNKMLKSLFSKFLVYIGQVFLSSVYQKLVLTVLLIILVLIHPFFFFIISLLDCVIIAGLLYGIKVNNRLLDFISLNLLKFFFLSTIIGVLVQVFR